MSSRSTITAS